MAKRVSVIVHGLVGWAICGATIGIGRQIVSMRATLAIHLVVAPLSFALLAWRHFKRHPGSGPLETSLALVGLVIGLDAFLATARSRLAFGGYSPDSRIEPLPV